MIAVLSTSHTREDGTVDGQKAVLERLLEVLVLERLLLCNDLVQVLAGVDGHLVASVSIVYAEEGYAHVRGGGLELLVALERLQVEHAGVRVLHAYPPALHGADSERDAVILTLVRVLRAGTWSVLCEGVARRQRRYWSGVEWKPAAVRADGRRRWRARSGGSVGEAYLLSHRLRQRLTHDCRCEFGGSGELLYGEKRANWFVLVDMWGSGSDWTLQRGDSAMW
jgi:hypothetical protein